MSLTPTSKLDRLLGSAHLDLPGSRLAGGTDSLNRRLDPGVVVSARQAMPLEGTTLVRRLPTSLADRARALAARRTAWVARVP
jgi:hypothetical protein